MPAIKFRGVDFIDFDTLLNDDERLVRDTARKFIEDNLVPIIEECNRAGRFPRELVKPMADLGFFGASLNGYGCAGMSNVEYGLVTQELERGDSGVRSFVSVQSALGDVSDLYLRQRRAEEHLVARAAERRKARLLRIDRTGLRIESRRHEDARAQSWKRVCAERREDVDHLRLDRRRGRDLGQSGRRKR